MANILVDTNANIGWTRKGAMLTPEQFGRVVRGCRTGEIVLKPTEKTNVYAVTYNR